MGVDEGLVAAAAAGRWRRPGGGRRAHRDHLHPDGRTIFVSAHATRRGGYTGTFSLDTAVGSLGGDAEWTPRGEWLLPFQGHYDARVVFVKEHATSAPDTRVPAVRYTVSTCLYMA